MDKIEWSRLTRVFFDRINRLVRYGSLTQLNSATGLQQAQLTTLDAQVLQDVEVFEPYGFTSAPHPDADALLAQVGAQRGNEVVVCIADRRYRLTTLVEGEVALFDDLGNVVHLTRSGIVIQAVEQVQVTAPQVTVDASNAVTVSAANSVTVNAATASVQATTSATVVAPSIGLTGATTVTGTLEVTGALTAAGGLAVTGDAGATVQGSLSTTGGDITADGVSLKNHVHGGVATGSGSTGKPT